MHTLISLLQISEWRVCSVANIHENGWLLAWERHMVEESYPDLSLASTFQFVHHLTRGPVDPGTLLTEWDGSRLKKCRSVSQIYQWWFDRPPTRCLVQEILVIFGLLKGAFIFIPFKKSLIVLSDQCVGLEVHWKKNIKRGQNTFWLDETKRNTIHPSKRKLTPPARFFSFFCDAGLENRRGDAKGRRDLNWTAPKL